MGNPNEIRIESVASAVEERSVEHSLRLMHPKMSRLHDIHTKCKLAQALKVKNGAVSFLTDEIVCETERPFLVNPSIPVPNF